MNDSNSLSVDVFYSMRSPYSYIATYKIKELSEKYNIKFNIRFVYPIAIRIKGFFDKIDPLFPIYLKHDCIRVSEMKNIPFKNRQARFKAAIVIAWPDGKVLSKEATMEGLITFTPSGENGFGYDPIFYLPEFDKTSAEIKPEDKNKISHRAKAIKNIIPLLLN